MEIYVQKLDLVLLYGLQVSQTTKGPLDRSMTLDTSFINRRHKAYAVYLFFVFISRNCKPAPERMIFLQCTTRLPYFHIDTCNTDMYNISGIFTNFNGNEINRFGTKCHIFDSVTGTGKMQISVSIGTSCHMRHKNIIYQIFQSSHCIVHHFFGRSHVMSKNKTSLLGLSYKRVGMGYHIRGWEWVII
jgi:hypothetical protein